MTTFLLISILLILVAIAREKHLIHLKQAFITRQNKDIIMTQEELLGQLQALKAQNEKAKGEIVGKIAALEAAIANQGNTTPEVDAALADLKASIQATDDIVPDAPAEGGGETPAPEEPAA